MSPRSLLDQIAGRCVHFTGLQNPTCKAGVRYESVKLSHAPIAYTSDGVEYKSSVSWPCLKNSNHGGAECPSCHFLSAEEAQAATDKRQAEIAEFMHFGGLARKAIIERTKNRGGAGFIPCPKCGGRLGFSQAASNMHVHARCDTAGCLSWME